MRMQHGFLLCLGLMLVGRASGDEAKDQDRLQGTWRVVSAQAGGEDHSAELTPKCVFIFSGDTVVLQDNNRAPECRFALDATKKPKTIDITFKKTGDAVKGIYQLDGDDLKICYSIPDEERPTDFVAKAGVKAISFRLKRAKADDAAKRDRLDAAKTLADRLYEQGKTADAIEAYEKAVALGLDVHGPDHPLTGSLMDRLAELYRRTGQFAKAEPLYSHSLEVARRVYGPDDEIVENVENNLAITCKGIGDYGRAEKLLLHSLELTEKHQGLRAAETAIPLINLGELYVEWGKYKEAEPRLRRALRILEAKLGKDHPRTAIAVNALGLMYSRSGSYDEAEPLYRRALGVMEGDLGHALDAARVRNNMATLQLNLGQFEKALGLLRQSLDVLKEHLPDTTLETATCQNNVGIALIKLDRGKEAVAFFDDCVATIEGAAGKDSPVLGRFLNNQGVALLKQGDFNDSLERLRRSRRILVKALGEDNPDAAVPLLEIAAAHFLNDQLDKAEEDCQQCMGVLEKTPGGPDLPQYALCLQNQGLFLALQGKAGAAEKLGQSLEAEQRLLRRVFRFTSEPDMLDYLATIRFGLPYLMSLAADNPSDAETRKLALTWVLRRKTVVVDTLSRFREVQRITARDPEIGKWMGQRYTLAAQLQNLTPQPGDDAERFTARRASLVRQANEAESNLHQILSQKYPSQVGPDAADSDAVQKQLPRGSALIELVRADAVDFRAKHALEATAPSHYYAFILASGTAGPKLIDLGDAKAVDDALQKVRENIDKTAELYRDQLLDEPAQEEEFRALSRGLYDKTFGRLRPALGGATLVYLAPEGELSRLPFEALVDEEGKYLVQSFRFAYLSGGRDLLRPRAPAAAATAVFAGPNYNMTASDRLAQARALRVVAPADDTGPSIPTAVATRGTRGGHLEELKGAAAEAAIVKKALSDTPFGPVHVYQGDDAIEEEIKAEPAPRVLHLATHGFFFPRPAVEERDKFRSMQLGFSAQEGRMRRLDDPMMRSGIYLAGANVLAEGGRPEGVDDGWVTAAEVAQLNLHGTELVVLSACNTGLGDVRTGEGVSGLRQAFQYAGARTLLSSLFPVPDSETRDMMRPFYEALRAGKGKLAALHDAQLAVLEQRKAAGKGTHPFFWAAFILVGDPE